MTVLFSSLTAAVIPRLDSLLKQRSEPYASNVRVADGIVQGVTRLVTVVQGAGSGTRDTLDDTALRVNVYADSQYDAEDLALLVRALFEGPVCDGDPVVGTRVNAGPIPISDAPTGLWQWYMVVDVKRRGVDL